MTAVLERAATISVVCLVFLTLTTYGGDLTIQFRSGATNLVLGSSDARQQLLAATTNETDATHAVTWSVAPAGVVRIDKGGRVEPVVDGTAVISATARDGSTAALPVAVVNSGRSLPINFGN